MENGVYPIASLEVLSPGLARSFRNESLQRLFRDLEVEFVEHAVVVEDLAARK